MASHRLIGPLKTYTVSEHSYRGATSRSFYLINRDKLRSLKILTWNLLEKFVKLVAKNPQSILLLNQNDRTVEIVSPKVKSNNKCNCNI